MIRRLVSFGRGGVASLIAMTLYAVSIGCFIALMLLVISMEEGGDNLTSATWSLMCAIILLSEGVGFSVLPVTVTIMPLLLTVMLIALIRAFCQRCSTDPAGYCGGLIVWLMLSELARQGTQTGLQDDAWIVLLKCAIVFTIGYLLAAAFTSRLVSRAADLWREHVSNRVRTTLHIGFRLGCTLVLAYLAIGLITVIVWIVRNHAAVVRLYELIGMGTGSRIVTTIACVAWLPNLCIWALSWLFGGGFAIGDIAEFTLWRGQASSLPALPVFGLLPEPVGDDTIRMLLTALPLLLSMLIALIAMITKRGCFVLNGNAMSSVVAADNATIGSTVAGSAKAARAEGGSTVDDVDNGDDNAADGEGGGDGTAQSKAGSGFDWPSERRSLLGLAYPAGAFCLASGVVALAMSILFALSNGGLGHARLAHLGVDVVQSTRVVGHGTALGLLVAWLLVLIGVAGRFGIRWMHMRVTAGHVRPTSAGPVVSTTTRTVAQGDRAAERSTARTVAGFAGSKEEQHDEHAPSDSTGFGLSLS
ncbi:DUF6350 family protein [Bifidobacterium jacchi]|uniref:Uncharacterized protein n=1 Tax=Bifidobacterium jacchi TaxID=2490545 RepID=A0A5N5RI56_9BIFI|nr:DUF6350 family protein [Bifidobacterium jacchi]KAB5606976.1 hypothetical protein EHS19_05900 [Bifidobacterium jacchi]